MKFSYHFRHLDLSQELVNYVQEKAAKLKKYELKPVLITTTFSVERHSLKVEVHVSGKDTWFRAEVASKSFIESIDKVFQKLTRQMSKKKARVQSHKCIEHSSYGKLSQLNEELEPVHPPIKRVAA